MPKARPPSTTPLPAEAKDDGASPSSSRAFSDPIKNTFDSLPPLFQHAIGWGNWTDSLLALELESPVTDEWTPSIDPDLPDWIQPHIAQLPSDLALVGNSNIMSPVDFFREKIYRLFRRHNLENLYDFYVGDNAKPIKVTLESTHFIHQLRHTDIEVTSDKGDYTLEQISRGEHYSLDKYPDSRIARRYIFSYPDEFTPDFCSDLEELNLENNYIKSANVFYSSLAGSAAMGGLASLRAVAAVGKYSQYARENGQEADYYYAANFIKNTVPGYLVTYKGVAADNVFALLSADKWIIFFLESGNRYECKNQGGSISHLINNNKEFQKDLSSSLPIYYSEGDNKVISDEEISLNGRFFVVRELGGSLEFEPVENIGEVLAGRTVERLVYDVRWHIRSRDDILREKMWNLFGAVAQGVAMTLSFVPGLGMASALLAVAGVVVSNGAKATSADRVELRDEYLYDTLSEIALEILGDQAPLFLKGLGKGAKAVTNLEFLSKAGADFRVSSIYKKFIKKLKHDASPLNPKIKVSKDMASAVVEGKRQFIRQTPAGFFEAYDPNSPERAGNPLKIRRGAFFYVLEERYKIPASDDLRSATPDANGILRVNGNDYIEMLGDFYHVVPDRVHKGAMRIIDDADPSMPGRVHKKDTLGIPAARYDTDTGQWRLSREGLQGGSPNSPHRSPMIPKRQSPTTPEQIDILKIKYPKLKTKSIKATVMRDGEVFYLVEGTSESGLKSIRDTYKKDFASIGVDNSQKIMNIIMEAVEKGAKIDASGSDLGDGWTVYELTSQGGNSRRIAVKVENNAIVSAKPVVNNAPAPGSAKKWYAGRSYPDQTWLDRHKGSARAPDQEYRCTVDRELIDALSKNTVNFDEPDVLATGIMVNGEELAGAGQIVFLENGDEKAGLIHIAKRHTDDFATLGVQPGDIKNVVMKALTEGRFMGYRAKAKDPAPIFETMFNEQNMKIAVAVGTNGYVVTAYPLGR
jgi:hypothetical protein